MSLGDLPASELARIDSVCLDYEHDLRAGKSPSIDDVVRQHGGQNAGVLREELHAIRDEVQAALQQPGKTSAGRRQASAGAAIELPTVGTAVGPYTIGAEIGRGGMGVVYQATDQRLDRQVAIKMLTVDAAKRTALTERFQREARAVAALSHPNIVELFDIGVRDGLPYAVMEYLDGMLLDQRLEQGPMEPAEVRRLGAQIADALAAAHSGGVIHRDLKPHNIMLVRRQGGGVDELPGADGSRRHDHTPDRHPSNESTVVKLFDFGLSRVPRSEQDDADQTGEGVVLGTPGYMAPEQARGEKVTAAADLFALGCVLHEAFYGARAFDGTTSAAKFRATIEQTPPVDPIRRRVDVDLAELIASCLQKEADKRPRSAAEVAARLRLGSLAKRAGEDSQQRRPPPLLFDRRHWLALVGGGAVGAAAGGMLARHTGTLESVKSIAVLTFDDRSEEPSRRVERSTRDRWPIGDRELSRAEKLSSLLVHELTRVSTLSVPRYRPIQAATAEEFRSIGRELGVDALLAGSIQTVGQNDRPRWVVQLQLVSGTTGGLLWSKRIESAGADDYLQQSRLATEIAAAIGQRLTSTADQSAPPSVQSFRCLVEAKTRSDPESVAGLVKALECFQDAHQVDRRYAAPLAGIALTSITLAAQSGTDESVRLSLRAREAVAEALAIDPTSVDARLAGAMLDWQTTNRYQQAERTFRELCMVAPHHWQVLHQYGLLQLTMGQFAAAGKSLREASQLNPWSVLAKVDRLRAMWFSGNAERAIREATRIQDTYDRHPLARGLLIDILEQLHRFDDAIALHDTFNVSADYTPQDYFDQRRQFLGELPYGPFGETMNQAIWQSRLPEGIDEDGLSAVADTWPPMLPLVLAVHPSFHSARLLETAKDILPQDLSH